MVPKRYGGKNRMGESKPILLSSRNYAYLKEMKRRREEYTGHITSFNDIVTRLIRIHEEQRKAKRK